MKRIISICLILTIFASLTSLSVFAEDGILVEIVEFTNYLNIEDNNSLTVKLTNKTAENANILLDVKVEAESDNLALGKEVSVALNKNSAVYQSIDLNSLEAGEYNLKLSAYKNDVLLTSYTEYIFLGSKTQDYKNIGVCTHLDFNTFYELSDIKLAKDSGFSIIRDECRWQSVEKVKGQLKIPEHVKQYIDETERNGVEVLLMLAFNNTLYSENECDIPVTEENIAAWLNYVEFVVNAFKGKIKYFEVWNEPNVENFNRNGATATQYAKLLKQTYAKIKAIYPEAYVVSGGIAGSSTDSDYIKEMMAAGALSHMDAFGIHPYCRDESIVDERLLISYSSDIDYLIKDCGITKDIWIAEVGYSTHEGEYTDEEKGAYNVRTMLEFIADGRVEKMLLYQLRHVDRGEGYGMIDSDGTAYDSFKIVRALGDRISNADFVKKWSGYYYSTYQFKDRSTGDDIFVMWTKKDTPRNCNVSTSKSQPSADSSGVLNVTLSVDLGTDNANSTLYKYDAYGNKAQIQSGSSFELDFKPTYIVCEKPQKESFCNITEENGYIKGSGYINNAAEFVTVRAEAKFAKKTAYIDQLEVENNGEFEFSFKIPKDDVYEIYVYNGAMNYEKINKNVLDAQITVTVNGNPLEDLTGLGENGKVSATVSVDSGKSEAENLNFIAAVYTYDNRLLYTQVKSVDVIKGEDNKGTVEFTAEETADWESLKLFLWDADSLENITEAIEIK